MQEIKKQIIKSIIENNDWLYYLAESDIGKNNYIKLHTAISQKISKNDMIELFAEESLEEPLKKKQFLKILESIRKKQITNKVKRLNLNKPLDEILQNIEKISSSFESTKHSETSNINKYMEKIVNTFTEEKKEFTIGLNSLDHYLKISNNDLCIIAARPGAGKSALGLQLAYDNALRGFSCTIYSFEMDIQKIAQRLIISQSESDSANDLAKAVAKVRDLPIYVNDNAKASLDYIKTTFSSKPTDIMIIDYLQLLSGNTNLNRREQISEITRELKVFAAEQKIPIFCLSQLNRQIENASTKRLPQLSDLKDSGSIEQDADQVIFIHQKNQEQDERKISIGKNRNGEKKTINTVLKNFRFYKTYGG